MEKVNVDKGSASTAANNNNINHNSRFSSASRFSNAPGGIPINSTSIPAVTSGTAGDSAVPTLTTHSASIPTAHVPLTIHRNTIIDLAKRGKPNSSTSTTHNLETTNHSLLETALSSTSKLQSSTTAHPISAPPIPVITPTSTLNNVATIRNSGLKGAWGLGLVRQISAPAVLERENMTTTVANPTDKQSSNLNEMTAEKDEIKVTDSIEDNVSSKTEELKKGEKHFLKKEKSSTASLAEKLQASISTFESVAKEQQQQPPVKKGRKLSLKEPKKDETVGLQSPKGTKTPLSNPAIREDKNNMKIKEETMTGQVKTLKSSSKPTVVAMEVDSPSIKSHLSIEKKEIKSGVTSSMNTGSSLKIEYMKKKFIESKVKSKGIIVEQQLQSNKMKSVEETESNMEDPSEEDDNTGEDNGGKSTEEIMTGDESKRSKPSVGIPPIILENPLAQLASSAMSERRKAVGKRTREVMETTTLLNPTHTTTTTESNPSVVTVTTTEDTRTTSNNIDDEIIINETTPNQDQRKKRGRPMGTTNNHNNVVSTTSSGRKQVVMNSTLQQQQQSTTPVPTNAIATTTTTTTTTAGSSSAGNNPTSATTTTGGGSGRGRGRGRGGRGQNRQAAAAAAQAALQIQANGSGGGGNGDSSEGEDVHLPQRGRRKQQQQTQQQTQQQQYQLSSQSNIPSPIGNHTLGDVFGYQNELDIRRAYNCIRNMVEFIKATIDQSSQRQVRDYLTLAQAWFNIQTIQDAAALPMPKASEICTVIDLIDAAAESFYGQLKTCREGQYMTECKYDYYDMESVLNNLYIY
jgi:hypothetical protein